MRYFGCLWVAFLAAALAGFQRAGGDDSLVRFSGSDGVELEYPSRWSRATPAAPLEPAPALALIQTDATGAVLRFGCFTLSFQLAPEQKTARFFAQSIRDEARAGDPQSLRGEIKDVQIGELPACYFELERPALDGRVLTRNWTVSWNGSFFLFTGSCPVDAPAEVAGEFQRLIDKVSFSPEYRKDDGSTTRFIDRLAKVSFSYPAHWHDDPPAATQRAQWCAYDDEGTRLAGVQLAADDLKDPGADVHEMAEELIARFSQSMEGFKVGAKRELVIDGTPAIEWCFRGQMKGDRERAFRLLLIRRDRHLVFLLGASVLPLEEKFTGQWQSLIDSMKLVDIE